MPEGPDGPCQAKQYHRSKLLASLFGSILFAGYAGLWVWWGGDLLVTSFSNRWLGLLIFAGGFGLIFEVITLPLAYYCEYALEHRYELSTQTITRWLSQLVKGWLAGGGIAALVLAGVYALLWYGGLWWWLWIWLAWVGFTVILAQLFPVLLLPLFYKFKPLEDDRITATLIEMARSARLKIEGIFSLELSADTKKANAMLTGLGSTRRVYLSDTLLESFSPEEIEVVFAHELGHHKRGHIWKMLLLSAGLSTLHIAVVVYFLNPLRGSQPEYWPDAVSLLPSILLCIVLVDILLTPVQHAISRRFERQCDGDALRDTGNPQAYRSAYRRLAQMNLADPDPHPLVEWYFHDHPAMSKRIALADSMPLSDG